MYLPLKKNKSHIENESMLSKEDGLFHMVAMGTWHGYQAA